jgi:hypothetical protein
MDTLLFLVVAAIFLFFILPRLSSMMNGGVTPNPQGNYPNNNGTLGGEIAQDTTAMMSKAVAASVVTAAAVMVASLGMFFPAPLDDLVTPAVRASSVHRPAVVVAP